MKPCEAPVRDKAVRQPLLNGAEAGAAPVGGARTTSLAALLTNHILSPGEIVLLILKPSLWFIVIDSAAFNLITLLIAAGIAWVDHRRPDHIYYSLGLCVIAVRTMWSTLQWMGRLYVLTDMRVLRIRGVFNAEIFDCALRQIARTRLIADKREKLFRIGSIEIIPKDESSPIASWKNIAKPVAVHEQLLAAISRAKQSGLGGQG
jgi:hypothetical protein